MALLCQRQVVVVVVVLIILTISRKQEILQVTRIPQCFCHSESIDTVGFQQPKDARMWRAHL